MAASVSLDTIVNTTYDLIVVGTGFASTFFLLSYLKKARANERILVLEKGKEYPHAWQLENRSKFARLHESTFINKTPEKPWIFSPAFGGGSNLWWACTPRMFPNDFRLKSTYGVGTDWPVSYDDLEPHYSTAEEVMAVSGPDNSKLFPRSKPYPQPPHRFHEPDKLLKQAYPDSYFEQPTARARRPTSKRPFCCAAGVCFLCPVGAKYTIAKESSEVFDDPRVTRVLEASVETLETKASQVSGVHFVYRGRSFFARGNLVALGANAIFNPHILSRSNIRHPRLGKGLNEQVSVHYFVHLQGLKNFQGSTSITGHGYMLYDGTHRSDRAACLIESHNVPTLRFESGRWTEQLELKAIFEVLPSDENYVQASDASHRLPSTIYRGHSSYTKKAMQFFDANLEKLLKPLPVEKVVSRRENSTESHILGTTLMGNDPRNSIVDRHLVHHDFRNLLVLGGSVFPSTPPANPTLTISALSLWAAEHL